MYFLNIKSDSRKIEPGDTFIALDGVKHNGSEYIMDAIQRGTSRVICKEGDYDVETVFVPDTHEYLIDYLDAAYHDTLKDMTLIGMTGTNGKTTTCFLIYQALNLLSIPCAYIGTIGFYVNGKVKELSNTTPDVLDLYEMILEAKREGCTHVVMEVSSHALSYKRVGKLKFQYALFSNLTEDHLDYHKTMENYAKEKQKLFSKVTEQHTCVINCDDEYCSYFLLPDHHNVTYGTKKSDYQITDMELFPSHTVFCVNHVKYDMKLLGEHNIYNMTCVIATLSEMGISEEQIISVISKLDPPKGRMEVIPWKCGKVIIDYAHTPDAVEKVILAAKEIPHHKIYTIVGCGGDRDPIKRPIMGRIATDLSDAVIFTSDNPRTEDPYQILKDITNHLSKKNFEVIENRKEAINKGIQMMKKDDILLVLGKGHENYQMIGNTKYDFDDKIVAETIIQEMYKE